jgi:hypothetical protein
MAELTTIWLSLAAEERNPISSPAAELAFNAARTSELVSTTARSRATPCSHSTLPFACGEFRFDLGRGYSRIMRSSLHAGERSLQGCSTLVGRRTKQAGRVCKFTRSSLGGDRHAQQGTKLRASGGLAQSFGRGAANR